MIAFSACNDTEFQCIDGSCIDRLYVCDGLPTCPNGEDEDKNCGKHRKIVVSTVKLW